MRSFLVPRRDGDLGLPVQAVQQKAEAELAALIDHAVNLGVGWPQIATQLGVTRQAARQQYQRRHRESASRHDRVA